MSKTISIACNVTVLNVIMKEVGDIYGDAFVV